MAEVEFNQIEQGGDPGPYKIPLSPASPTKAAPGSFAMPADVEAAIIAAPKTQDVFPVTLSKTYFTGKILKVDVLVFQPRSALLLSNFNEKWLAIVAKTVEFVEPSLNNAIVTEANWSPTRYRAPPAPATPPKAAKAGQASDGPGGQPGASGSPGQAGDSGPRVPDVYIIVGEIVSKLNKPLPQSLNFVFDVRGYSGGDGSDGGAGGNGGEGGDGGPSDWHDPGSYPLDPGCKAGAGSGGPGSVGGQGGPGGAGGNGSAGANMTWVGPQVVLDSLYYSRVFNQGSFGGEGGFSGQSGASGAGGARGEHTGGCGGGHRGIPVATPATPRVQAIHGEPQEPGVNDGLLNKQVEPHVEKYF